jgi:hypothetical protein
MSLLINSLEHKVYKETLRHHKDYNPFDMCLVRNREMDNRLSLANSTQLKISAKSGQVITVDNLPNYHRFDEANWVAMLCDEDKTNAHDGSGGDYLYKSFATIDRKTKKITLIGSLAAWEVGDNLVLYNPFMNYEFVGDQTSIPTWKVAGAPAWRASSVTSITYWLGLDGVYRCLLGCVSTSTGYATTGYATATSMAGPWTIQNGDAPVVTAANLADCSGTIYPSGSVIRLADNRNAVFVVYSDTSGRISIRIMLFDDNLTTITFTNKIFNPTYNLAAGGLEYFGGYFHVLYYYRPASLSDWEIRAAKCSTIDGTFVNYQTNIVKGSTSEDATAWKDHIDAVTIIKTKNKVFGLFGSTAYASISGSKGNRIYSLLDFDNITQTWSINQRGPVLINPFYWSNISADYDWASDHLGGFPGLFRDTDGQYYTAVTAKGSAYQGSLLRLKIKES